MTSFITLKVEKLKIIIGCGYKHSVNPEKSVSSELHQKAYTLREGL